MHSKLKQSPVEGPSALYGGTDNCFHLTAPMYVNPIIYTSMVNPRPGCSNREHNGELTPNTHYGSKWSQQIEANLEHSGGPEGQASTANIFCSTTIVVQQQTACHLFYTYIAPIRKLHCSILDVKCTLISSAVYSYLVLC